MCKLSGSDLNQPGNAIGTMTGYSLDVWVCWYVDLLLYKLYLISFIFNKRYNVYAKNVILFKTIQSQKEKMKIQLTSLNKIKHIHQNVYIIITFQNFSGMYLI
jgi:hypothetical protein